MSEQGGQAGSGGRRGLRITVARSGGVAGLRPRWSITATEEPELGSWLSLVESCPWDAPESDADAQAEGAGGTASGVPGADRFVYSIRVLLPAEPAPEAETDAAAPAERDARVPEAALEGPWRTLVDRVREASGR